MAREASYVCKQTAVKLIHTRKNSWLSVFASKSVALFYINVLLRVDPCSEGRLKNLIFASVKVYPFLFCKWFPVRSGHNQNKY